MSRKELRLTGSGGQGLILAGIIIAEACLIDGKKAVQTQSYGPEARGGASRSEVIVSDENIDYPKVTSPDIMLALTNEGLQKYMNDLNENSIIIADEELNIPDNINNKIYKAPIIKTAREKVGKEIVSNIVALGLITKITKIATFDSIKKAVLGKVPKGTEELNEKALEIGFNLL